MSDLMTLAECPAGLFLHGTTLGFKSEYTRANGSIDAYVVLSGEAFWGPQPQSAASQRSCLVQPVKNAAPYFERTDVPDPVIDFLNEVADEIERAAMLHPGPNPNLAALMEEVGEVARALLEARRDVPLLGSVDSCVWANIREEAVQVAAMAFRIVFEGDPTMDVVPEDGTP